MLWRGRTRFVRAEAPERVRVRELVKASDNDPLAPFALRVGKSHVYSTGGGAAIGYRVRLGVAVASGDPVGDRSEWGDAIDEFIATAQRHRWRVAALGPGEDAMPLWAARGFSGVPVGRDVVIDVADFSLQGRVFRNARQAIARADNAGVTVEVCTEQDLRIATLRDLRALRMRSHNASERGFSMLLGNLLDGTHPDELIAVARNRTGQPVAFQRYLQTGANGLSLDVPIRDPQSPNGVDERIIASMVDYARGRGIDRLSLAFAPFPELFEDHHGPLRQLGYLGVHLLDPLIRVESLWRFLRKFHAFGQQRYVVFHWRNLVRVATALLLLEFSASQPDGEGQPRRLRRAAR